MRLSLVCVLFDPAIPTSFFNFIQLFLYLYSYRWTVICACVVQFLRKASLQNFTVQFSQMQAIMPIIIMLISWSPRSQRRRRKGLVHTAHACAGVSIATSCVTIVIVCEFCMMYSSMGDKWRVYDSIRLSHIFLGSPGACACNVYQVLSPSPLGTRLISWHHKNIMA